MQSQVDRWASLNPTVVRSGKIFEVPGSYLFPRLGLVLGLAAAGLYLNQTLLWNQKPATLAPEFIEEAKKIGPVAQRVNAAPVYLDPFTNRIPGHVRGPEDLKKDF